MRSSLVLWRAPPQFVEEVQQYYNLVILLGRRGRFGRRQDCHTFAIRRQIPCCAESRAETAELRQPDASAFRGDGDRDSDGKPIPFSAVPGIMIGIVGIIFIDGAPALIRDSSGNLYGATTLAPYPMPNGTVFRLLPTKHSLWFVSVSIAGCRDWSGRAQGVDVLTTGRSRRLSSHSRQRPIIYQKVGIGFLCALAGITAIDLAFKGQVDE
jgi:hypothetical protein